MNEIQNQGLRDLGTNLAQSLSLTALTIFLESKLDFDGRACLCLLFQKCSNLQTLSIDLRFNSINQDQIADIGFGLNKCQNLRRLAVDLTWNQIGIKGAYKIGQDLGRCTNLTDLTLALSGNQLNDEAISNLFSGLENCQNLQNLDFKLGDSTFLSTKSHNYITNLGLFNLGSSLVKFSNLKTLKLDLSGNRIDNEGLFAFSLLIEKCSTLKCLILNLRNTLYFDGQSIPTSILNLFKQQYYQIVNQNNLNSFQKLVEFGQLIEQCLIIKQNLTDKQLNKIKLLSLQDLDNVYDLNNLQIKPFDNYQENPQCNCCQYENMLEFFELLKIVTKNYILVVIQDELKLENDELQQKCLVRQIIEHQNFLVKDQHSLQTISYELCYCQLLVRELKQKADFFDLKNKKNLVHLKIQLNGVHVKDIFKQFKQNKHKINTISSNNIFGYNQQVKNVFKKIPNLVQLF
ncbi:hypothetical protein ABPG72_011406 [Tetrahymena utriculariae]